MKMKTVLLTSLAASAGLTALAAPQVNPHRAQQDHEIQAAVSAQLQRKDTLHAVKTEVNDGIVTLTGEVPLYIDKVDAEKRARKDKNVDGVRNHVQVGGPAVADEEVRENLSTKLRYDRVGYGIVFNSLTVNVSNGVVTIAGNVRDYPSRDSALAIVSTTAGVKEVVDEIEVAPVSINDDRLRVRLAHAIYGDPSLKKYAIDPQAPIRIIVENGHVELVGVVMNDLDRQLAFTRANLVPGVFSVANHLSIPSEVKE